MGIPVHVGIIRSLGDFVRSRCTPEAQAVYDALVPADEALAFREVPDERVRALVDSLASAERTPAAELLADYGRFWAIGAKAAYPSVFAAPDAKSFLLRFGGIHVASRALPGASPPDIAVRDAGPDRLVLRYQSRRLMCGLVRGMVEGIAESYGERVRIAEPECQLRGDARCTFEVEFGGGRS
ncbi:MAG TPA: heme NO-binding domain-containing protein [Anaeromyxobacteraceae bacterium]|nr:heme NO-binding domain-containing protein [Anaeromyxobacteraceae bacterium]